MFDKLLRNHVVVVLGPDGQPTTERVTCAEIQDLHEPHVREVQVSDGHGGTKPAVEISTCSVVNGDLRRLYAIDGLATTLDTELKRSQVEVARLNRVLDDYRRVMAGAMQIIFRLGPALQSLLDEIMGNPTLTDDGTMVKIEARNYAVLIDPFEELILVRDITGVVPQRRFALTDGRLTLESQTMLLGYIGRINKAASDGGHDPVTDTINLLTLTTD